MLGRILTNRAIPIKIVLISSTVTWTGSWSSAIISDVERAFYMRVPLQSANDLYELENQVVQLSKRYKLDCSVISTGLIYGRDGMDLGEIFR